MQTGDTMEFKVASCPRKYVPAVYLFKDMIHGGRYYVFRCNIWREVWRRGPECARCSGIVLVGAADKKVGHWGSLLGAVPAMTSEAGGRV